MTERIDHAAIASEWAGGAKRPDLTMEETAAFAGIAQAHATLALVEQQRIANLIALGQVVAGDGSRPFRHLVMVPVNEIDVAPHPRVAAALGLDTIGDPR